MVVRLRFARQQHYDRGGMQRGDAQGLPARVRDIVYRGPVTHFYLDSAAGPLLAYQQNARAGEWAIGDELRCAWDGDSAVVLEEARE